MKRLASCIALALCALPASVSAAVLAGTTIGEDYRFPDISTSYPQTTYSPQSFTVGAGQESTIVIEGVTAFNVDFADTMLDIAFDTVLSNPQLQSTSFNGLVFTSAAFAQITGVTIGASSNLAGFDASRVAIVGNELRLNWSGLSYDTDTMVSLTFAAAPVPEAQTWAMMVVGFGLLGAGLRRRTRCMATA